MPEPVSLTRALAHCEVLPIAFQGTATSPEAAAIRDLERVIAEFRESSIALFGEKSRALSKIQELVAGHAEAGWDGEGAEPVSRLAATRAERLIRALPNNLPVPEFAPEPDGSISLDWIHSRTRLISVSVGETDRLAYAWLDGTDRGHAVAHFDGERIPSLILDTIRELVLPPNASIRVA